MGFFDWFFNGKEIQPQTTPYQVPWALGPWSDVLFSSLFQGENGSYGIRGTDKYPGNLSPDLNDTLFPSILANWSPQGGPGMQYMNNFLNSGGYQMPQNYTNAFNSMLQYGGAGGRPTELLGNMTQFGGTGGVGHQAIANTMQYGAPSQVGQYLSNLAQFGGIGPGAEMLYNRASGGPTAAANYLSAYSKRK